jgi:hypothetical protein
VFATFYNTASTSKRHLLPQATTIRKIYKEYEYEEALREVPILKERRFRQISKDHLFHKVSFSTVAKVSMCDICVEYEYKKAQEKDLVKRQELYITRNLHKHQEL